MLQVPEDNNKEALKTSLESAEQTDLNQSVEVYKMARDTGADVSAYDILGASRQKVNAFTSELLNEQKILEARRKADMVYNDAPVMSRVLSNGYIARIARDNIDVSVGLERWLKDQGAIYQQSNEQLDLAKFYSKAFSEGRENDPDVLERVRQVQERGAVDYGTGFTQEVARGLPSVAKTVQASVVGALATGTTAGTVGLLGGPQTAVPAFLGGARLGAIGGAAKESYEMNRGSVLMEIGQLTDSEGRKIDRNVQKVLADTSSVLMAGLDIVGLEKLASTFPAVKQFFGKALSKQGLKQIIQNPTAYKALQRFAARVSGAAITEASTEAIQELVQALAVNEAIDISNDIQGTDFTKITAGEMAERSGETFVKTLPLGIVLGGAGAGLTSISESSLISRANAQKKRIEELGKLAKADKVLQRTPDVQEQIVKEVLNQSANQYAYIDTEAMNAYFPTVGIDPEGVAKQMGVLAEYRDAVESGADLAVPMEKFYSVIAPSEHLSGLANHISFEAGGLSVAQLEQMQKMQARDVVEGVMKEAEETVPTDVKQEKDLLTISREIESMALKAKQRSSIARGAGRMVSAFVKTMSERTGQTPKQFWEGNRLEIIKIAETLDVQKGETVRDAMLRRGREIEREEAQSAFGEDLGTFVRGYFKGKTKFAMPDEEGARSGLGAEMQRLRDDLAFAKDAKGRKVNLSKGFASLFGKGGMPLDKIREVLAENNFIESTADLSEVVDLLSRVFVQGEKIYPSNFGDKLYQGEDFNRGAIERMGDDYLISLFKQSNETTLLHELGHYFHFVFNKYAQSDKAPAGLKEDYQKTLDWLGIKDASEMGRDQYEKFARGFEAYLFEGKSPSKALANVFRAFWRWVKKIYEDIRALNVELDESIKGVMDRMLSTDAEIDAYSKERSAKALFTTAEEAGMSEKEFARYMRSTKEGIDQAKDEVIAAAIKQLGADRVRTYRQVKESSRVKAEYEADRNKAFIAQKYMITGELDRVDADGKITSSTLKPTKIDPASAEAYLEINPELFINENLVAKDGEVMQSADVLAEGLGYESGLEMLNDLSLYPNKTAWIKTRTDQLTQETFDLELLTEENIKEAVIESFNNESRIGMLKLELRALEKLANEPFIDFEDIDRQAEVAVNRMRVNAMRPKQFEMAAIKMATQSALFVSKRNHIKALEYKRKQLVNLAIARMVRNNVDYIEKSLKRIDGLNKGQPLKNLVKASVGGEGYYEAVKTLRKLHLFETPGRESLERLQSWHSKRLEALDQLVIDENILARQEVVSWKELTFRDFTKLTDAFENIYTVARKSLEFKDGERMMDEAEVRGLLIDKLVKSFPKRFKAGTSVYDFLPDKKSFKYKVGQLMNMLEIPEFAFKRLDAYDDNGPFWSFIYNRLATAKNDFLLRENKAKQELKKILSTYTPDDYLKPVVVKGLENVVKTKQDALVLLLNAGNEYNFGAVIDGLNTAGVAFDGAKYESFINSLPEKDLRFAQSVWDFLNTFWPEVKQANLERTGVDLERVEGRPIKTRYGTFAGGYFPLVFNKDVDQLSGQRAEYADIIEANKKGVFAPMTKHGHRIARTGSGGKPVNLSMSVLSKHLDALLKDLTMFDAIRQIDRLITKPDLASAISRVEGPDAVRGIREWLSRSISDGNAQDQAGLFAGQLRANVSSLAMGFKATTFFAQFMGGFTTIDEVGVRYSAKALNWLYGGKLEERRKFIYEASPQLKLRAEVFDRDIRDAMRNLTERRGVLSTVQKVGFIGIQIADREVASHAWVAGYLKGIEEMKLDQQQAFDYADSVVRTTQASGLRENLSTLFATDNNFLKLLTMFGSFFNVLYNRFAMFGGKIARGKMTPGKALISLAVLWWIPAAIGELILNRAPGEEEDWWEWFLRNQIQYPLGAIPIVGQGARAATDKVFDRYVGGGITPVDKAILALADFAGDVSKISERDGDENFDQLFVSGMYLSGYAFGLPAAQINTTYKSIKEAYEGEDVAPIDFLMRPSR